MTYRDLIQAMQPDFLKLYGLNPQVRVITDDYNYTVDNIYFDSNTNTIEIRVF